MTVKQLIEALSEYPDDAIVDVRVQGCDCHDFDIDGIYDVTTLVNASWVTLALVE